MQFAELNPPAGDGEVFLTGILKNDEGGRRVELSWTSAVPAAVRTEVQCSIRPNGAWTKVWWDFDGPEGETTVEVSTFDGVSGFNVGPVYAFRVVLFDA